MDDKKQIKLLYDAIKAYENGEIIEAKDLAIEFINKITDYEVESEDRTKIDCSKTKCENCTNHNYCDYELNSRQESEG